MRRFFDLPYSLPWIVGSCGVFLLMGCGGRQVSPFDHLNPQQARELAQQISQQRDADLQADLQAAFAHHRPGNILILSGGDASGAFGCGVLAGWRHAAGDARPVFDIVTGVSTGALMATFAFLGEEKDDADLREVYTHVRDKDIMEGPLTLGPPNSVFDTAPLRRLIAKYVTPDSIKRVAAAHAQGRRLYVATVELDTGMVVIWPLSKIAAEAIDAGRSDGINPAGRERFCQVLLAAASIPVVFPPVEIDGGLHVDAGLRETVFLRKAMLGFSRAFGSPVKVEASWPAKPQAAEDCKDDAVAVASPPAVYAIFNGRLRADPAPVADDVLHIGIRSLEIYTESLQIFNLRDAAHLAAAHDPPFRFRWLAEPDDLDSQTIPSPFAAMFDPVRMTRLFVAGEKLAGRAGFWSEGAPRLDGEVP